MYKINNKELKFKGLNIKKNKEYRELIKEIKNMNNTDIYEPKFLDKILKFVSEVYYIDDINDVYDYLYENAEKVTDITYLLFNIEIELADSSTDDLINDTLDKVKKINEKLDKCKTKIKIK